MGVFDLAEPVRQKASDWTRPFVGYAVSRVRKARRKVTTFVGRLPARTRRVWAVTQNRLLNGWLLIVYWVSSNATALGLAFASVLAVLSDLLVPTLQTAIAPGLDADHLNALRALLVGVGGALIGATAIIFAVVPLAVQINFARVPHGLFRKLSADPPLLLCFAATFLLGAVVGASSLYPDKSWVAGVVVLSTWCVLGALGLFFAAYVRALDLISPAKQLQFILRDVERSLNRWSKWATRSAPLIERRPSPRTQHDMGRAAFFLHQRGWEATSRNGLTYTLALARINAEQGDYEVANAALGGLVAINQAYVAARGRTFFASNPFFENPLASEGFISDVLEDMRRLAVTAQGRKDERQFIQVITTLERLAEVYARIDYGQDHGVEMHHAQLATSYLTSALEAAGGTFGADVTMEGVRLMGRAGLVQLASRRALGVATLGDHIAALALSGLRPGFEPIVSTSVAQLATFSFELLRSGENDVDYASGNVRGSIGLVARAVLSSTDSAALSRHSGHMAPYYSLAASGTFGDRMTSLVNALSQQPKESDDARRVLGHIEEWSDGMYQGEKDLLLLAVAKRSFLALDLITWICHITKVLVHAANAPAASEHISEQLVRNATWLISVLDWLPGDKEAVTFLETFRVTDHLFEAAMDARGRGADEVAVAARDTLLRWAFKAGQHQTGWASLERALTALALASAWETVSTWPTWLLGQVQERLATNIIPDERRMRAAKELRRESRNFGRGEFAFTAYDVSLSKVDRARFGSLMNALADLLEQPKKPDQPAEPERG